MLGKRKEGQASPVPYAITRIIVTIGMPIAIRLHTEGLKNIPRTGPVILAMNHIHWLDILAAALRVPRITHYMAKIELFSTPVLGGMMRLGGAFPVRRGEGDREALRTAERLLAEGEVVVIFPEGHRSDTGVLIQAHPGVALIALRSNAPIVPVAISGTRAAFKGKRFLFWAPKVTIRYGKPFTLDAANGKRTRESLAEATDQIMYTIADLLPPEQRGPYASRPQASGESAPLDTTTREPAEPAG